MIQLPLKGPTLSILPHWGLHFNMNFGGEKLSNHSNSQNHIHWDEESSEFPAKSVNSCIFKD